MAVAKILLFYRFVPLADPEAVKLWQLELCTRLGLRGRIIISPHGINATLGGELDACKAYLKAAKRYAPFKELDEKWSAGTGLDGDGLTRDFPRLSVKTRPELVAFGAPGIAVDADGVVHDDPSAGESSHGPSHDELPDGLPDGMTEEDVEDAEEEAGLRAGVA